MDRVYTLAIKAKSFKCYDFNFLNEYTKLPTNIKVTGIGLASAEYRSEDSSGYECIILLDNKQIFYYSEDSLKKNGRYVICNDLINVRDYNPRLGIIEKALDTIKYYPI
ncbi:MAG: hypothetical protein ACOX3R_07595 [Desulfitobacteriia bacterium]|jgi:hypothetical protein